jgi:GTP-binding protein EngB required for normal cell division
VAKKIIQDSTIPANAEVKIDAAIVLMAPEKSANINEFKREMDQTLETKQMDAAPKNEIQTVIQAARMASVSSDATKRENAKIVLKSISPDATPASQIPQIRLFPKTEDTINVLTIGKTRAGKSAFIELLNDPDYIAPTMTLFSSTRIPDIKEVRIDKVAGRNVNKRIRFIDTPGLGDVTEINKGSMTNTTILTNVVDFINTKKIHIDCVLFFATVDTGVDDLVLDALKEYEYILANIKDTIKFAWVITRAEKMDGDRRKQIVEELHQRMHNPPKYILFSGVLDQTKLDELEYDSDEEDLEHSRRRLVNMKKLINSMRITNLNFILSP